MPWTKLSDDFASHPKVLALGQDAPHALSVWVAGACYASRYLTEGFLPDAAVQGPGLTTDEARAAAAQLVRVGLWEPADGGYRVHDFLDFNPSRAFYETKRRAGRDGARARWGTEGEF